MMTQKAHKARFSHDLALTSNGARFLLLGIFVWAFVACSSVSGNVSSPGARSTIAVNEEAGATPHPTATASPVPTFIPAIASPTPSETQTVTPTPTVSPTPFLTPPPPGQAAAIPILMYHHLGLLDPNASVELRTWTVSPITFGEQLDYLVAHDYHTVSFRQLDSFFEERTVLPTRPVILTFDDGWSDDYSVAFPALQEHGMIGTFFVPTAYAGAPGGKLLSWEQIGEMDAAGMEFGGHTINHADLKKLTKEEALRQLSVSKSKMEDKLGHPTIAFAYPFGTYNADVVALVREVGYRAAVGLCCGFKLFPEKLLTLPRIRISYDDALSDFAKKLPPETMLQ